MLGIVQRVTHRPIPARPVPPTAGLNNWPGKEAPGLGWTTPKKDLPLTLVLKVRDNLFDLRFLNLYQVKVIKLRELIPPT